MKLLRVQASHFGPLRELDTGPHQPLGSLVVVLGPNEAGKSSFHQAVVSLLYGFYPATRDGHPLAPWGGESPELRGWLSPAEGPEGDEAPLEIHRRLLSRPTGTVSRGARVEELRNRELDQVAHVDRKVFQQVYALTLWDLAGLESEGWAAVQDRLVVGMGAAHVRSPRDAAEALEQSAAGLWRPDRRGRPRYTELRGELDELRDLRRIALDRDREIRALHGRADEDHETLERLRAEHDELERELARIRRLLPVVAGLRQRDRLAALAGPEEELADLPPDPAGTLEGLEERVSDAEERMEALRARRHKLEGQARPPTAAQEALLERHGELRALADRAPILQERAAQRGHREAEVEQLRRRIRSIAGPLFGEERTPDAATLEAVPHLRVREGLEEIRRIEARLGAARDELEALEAREPLPGAGPVPRGSQAAAAAGLLSVVAGIAALGWGGAPVLGGLLVLAGLAGVGWGLRALARWQVRTDLVRNARADRRRREEALRVQTETLKREAEAARAAVDELLVSLPPLVHPPGELGPELARDLAQLRDLVQELEGRQALLASMALEDADLRDTLSALVRELEALADLPPEPVEALPELGRRLAQAQEARRSREAAEGELEALATEEARAREQWEQLRSRKEELESAIRRAGGESVPLPQALRRARERLEAADRLRDHEESLAAEHPDLLRAEDEVRRAVEAGEAWTRDPEATEALERRRRELSDQMAELRERVTEARTRLQGLESEDTVDLVDGRIARVQEEMGRVVRERDRCFALARLIRVAERRFRDAHQPDLLRRAGVYLERITGGRYARLLLADGSGEEPFMLEAPHLPGPRPVSPPLSTATREQVYLALRFAIVDHLDRGRDPLPLFLDEILVNWDRERRERGLELLVEMADRRQVFLFTCHPDLAAAMEDRGARVVHLSPPGETP